MSSLIWTDKATTEDRLGFDDYRRTLVRVVQSAETPITIGIFGPWGSGKTSLMMMIRQDLDQALAQTIWFDAWKYDREEALWRALLVSVLRTLRDALPEEEEETRDELEQLQVSIYQSTDRERLGGAEIDWSQLVRETAKGVVKLSLSFIPSILFLKRLTSARVGEGGDPNAILAALHREKVRLHEEVVRTLEEFQERFGRAVRLFLEKTGRPFVAVFVDDLDRCLPEKAVQVLESIKLFLDVPGCIFILGVDRSVVEKGIEAKYTGQPNGPLVDGDDYLRKIVQVPFNLPPLERSDILKFIETEVRQSFPRNLAPIFAAGLEANPRQIKRTLNIFRLLWTLAEERPGLKKSISPGLLAKIVVIQTRFRGLYNDIVDYPNLIGDLEDYFERESSAEKGTREGKKDAAESPRLVPRLEEGTLLSKYAYEKGLKGLLLAGRVRFRDSDIRPYIFLTRTATARSEELQEQVIDAKLWEDLLSNDATRLRAAAEKIDPNDQKGYVKRLLQVMADPKTYRPSLRVSAGNALAYLGDPRDLGEMVEIDAGDFLYGERNERVRFPHAFRAGKYPVTNSQYKRFMEETDRAVPYVDGDWAEPHNWDPKARTYPEGRANHPVVLVTWEDAQAYCLWLSQKTGKDYCLPTEQEWERVARGVDGRAYPWGERFEEDRANTRESGIGSTTPVGVWPNGAAPCGALDLSGNIWEWMDNNYDKETKVLRGGSWEDGANEVSATGRDGMAPGNRDYNIGFRVVETTPPGDGAGTNPAHTGAKPAGSGQGS